MLFTITQVKKITGLSTSSIYRHFESGLFTKVKIGNSTRVELPADLMEKYKDKIALVI